MVLKNIQLFLSNLSVKTLNFFVDTIFLETNTVKIKRDTTFKQVSMKNTVRVTISESSKNTLGITNS
jgi:hypothetical protein